jgi:hypothetical protein
MASFIASIAVAAASDVSVGVLGDSDIGSRHGGPG